MAMHSCRIWPKGRRRLNHSCPSKERESYQEVGPRRKDRERRGAGRSSPFPGSSAWQERQTPFTTSHTASSGPTLRGSARPGSLTLVTVGEVSSARAVDQPVRGSGAVLCGEWWVVRRMGGDGAAGVRRGWLPFCHVGGGSLRRPGCEWASTASGVDTYQRNRSYNPRMGSCQGRNRPGPGGYLQ